MGNLEQKTFNFAEEPENLKQGSYEAKKKMSTKRKIIYGTLIGTALASGMIGSGIAMRYKMLDAHMSHGPYPTFSMEDVLNGFAGAVGGGSDSSGN